MFREGYGTPRDAKAAAKWEERSRARGYKMKGVRARGVLQPEGGMRGVAVAPSARPPARLASQPSPGHATGVGQSVVLHMRSAGVLHARAGTSPRIDGAPSPWLTNHHANPSTALLRPMQVYCELD